MMRNFIKNSLRYICAIAILTAVFTAVLLVFNNTDVFSKYKATEPYVTGAPYSQSVTVTNEGDNAKGGEGTGIKTVSADVPTCEGDKGTKTNPFVALEIVPDKSEQELVYLGQNEDEKSPLDVMQIGIDITTKNSKSFAKGASNPIEESEIANVMGQWFINYKYEVNKFGPKSDNPETEKISFAYQKKLYSIKIKDTDIEELKDDERTVEKFNKIYDNYYNSNNNNKNGLVKALSEKFPEFFEKDSDGNNIRDIAIENNNNWTISREEKVTVIPEESETYKGTGYMVMVDSGEKTDAEGNVIEKFGFASEEDCKNWKFTKTGDERDRWVYVATKEELQERYPEAWANLTAGSNKDSVIYANGFWSNIEGAKFDWSELDVLYANQGNKKLTNIVMELSKSNWITCKYVKQEEEKTYSYTYNFDYYGLASNNILKRSLFQYTSQEEYDDFQVQVICMTPAELNKMSEDDTEATIDMIERADMFYIHTNKGADGSKVNGADSISDLYYKYVAVNEQKSNEEISFYENDLEWSLCQKIMKRLSSVASLPLVFNQKVGTLLEYGVNGDGSNVTHMYITKGIGDTEHGQNSQTRMVSQPMTGSLNNLAKLYLISIQFDLTATTGGEEGLTRSFMENIYDNIQTVKLPTIEGALSNSAKTTGYYKRQLCTCGKVSDDYEQRAYYLWNAYTFVPVDLEVNFNDNLSDEAKELLQKYGFVDDYFNTNNGNPFRGSESHQSGGDGEDGRNVTVISSGSNSDTNHSSLIGDQGDGGNRLNGVLDTIYTILKGNQKGEAMTVVTQKQPKVYVKIANDTVMINYENDGKEISDSDDKQLHVRVKVLNNSNNRDGQIKSVKLCKPSDSADSDDSDAITVKLYKDKTLKEECDNYEEDGEKQKNQYVVSQSDGFLNAYIPFTLKEWKNGYNVLKITTVAHSYNEKKKKVTTIKKEYSISIIGRTLFDLE